MHTFRHFLSYLVKNFVEIPFLSPEFIELCKQEAARSFVNCVVYCKKSRLTSIILSFQQTEQNHYPQQEFHLMKEKCVSWRGSSFHHISSPPRHEASQCRYYSTEIYPKSKSWFREPELDVICCVTIQKLILSRPSLHSPSCLITSSRSHSRLNSSI